MDVLNILVDCVKAIYSFLRKAIYYLFNIFKERKSIVCRLSTRVYIVNNYKEYIGYKYSSLELFPCEKTTQAIWLKRLGNEEPFPLFYFWTWNNRMLVECLINVHIVNIIVNMVECKKCNQNIRNLERVLTIQQVNNSDFIFKVLHVHQFSHLYTLHDCVKVVIFREFFQCKSWTNRSSYSNLSSLNPSDIKATGFSKAQTVL